MPVITPKSHDVIQAQVAAFTTECVSNNGDRLHLYNHIGSLAAQPLHDPTRVAIEAEYRRPNGTEIAVAAGDTITVAEARNYTDFLRSVGGSARDAIKVRADLLGAYGVFAPAVQRLRGQLADPSSCPRHPDFVGIGASSAGFRVSHEDREYIARIPTVTNTRPIVIDSHLAGAVLGRGVPRLEHIVAASYDDGVTIAEVMSGKQVPKLTAEELGEIPDSHLSKLVDTLAVTHCRGIKVDHNPPNFFYDLQEGFGIVDYHPADIVGRGSDVMNLGRRVGLVAKVFDDSRFCWPGYTSRKTQDEYVLDLKSHRATLGVLDRYEQVVADKLNGEDLQEARMQIRRRTAGLKQTIEDYSNPEWVAQAIAKTERRTRQQGKQPAYTAKP